MNTEGDEEFYAENAVAAGEEIKKLLDCKARAIRGRDYNEVYRLAGAITMLCSDSESIDREMYLLYGETEETEDDQ